ncbi:putative monooxygenase [Xylaria sp. FL0933]|nr:putative monooxygenase [Xylaria sp. FL0933]
MAQRTYPHVLIAGAGLSGLALAQFLRKEGVSFEIFERDESVDARTQGWAIALHGPLLADLKASMPEDIGPIEQKTNHLTPLDHIPPQIVFYDATKPDMRVGVTDDDSHHFVRANRQRLRDWLRQHIPVQYDKRVVGVDDSGEKVVVHFADGSSASGDILIGAEGTRSTVRKHILHGQDVMKPLPVGSLVGETELTGAEFASQLELGHSAYIVFGPPQDQYQFAMFAGLNKVSPDGKTGYYYFLLFWIDEKAAQSTDENPYWTVNASREDLAAFARKATGSFPEHLRALPHKVPVERYLRPGIVLHSVELDASQLPPGRVMLIGDAAHSMSPCKYFLPLPFPIEQGLTIPLSVRAEAGVCALRDASDLGRTLTRIRDTGAKDADLEKLMAAFRDGMLGRAVELSRISNAAIGEYARNNYKLYTCGKEAEPLPKESIVLEKVLSSMRR